MLSVRAHELGDVLKDRICAAGCRQSSSEKSSIDAGAAQDRIGAALPSSPDRVSKYMLRFSISPLQNVLDMFNTGSVALCGQESEHRR